MGKRQPEAAERGRFPACWVSAYTKMCPEGTEGVFLRRAGTLVDLVAKDPGSAFAVRDHSSFYSAATAP